MRQRTRPGTRFRLYPQYDEGFAPEVVEVSSPAGSLAPGPADHRMYVANASAKLREYEPPKLAPPYAGAEHPPAEPDRAGHFDAISLHCPQFRAAHLFGTVRLVLDIWETQLGGTVRWWHPDAPDRLELVPFVQWQNAQSGPGFLETGFWPGPPELGPQLFCFNFDVIAHEVGHAILFGLLGVPEPSAIDAEFLGFHESFGDLVALLGGLHFPGVRRRLLDQTAGDLYAPNLVNRLAETAPHQQLRMASSKRTMRDVAGLAVRPDGSWYDPAGLGRNAHDMSLPMTGAVFDLLVETYQAGLAARGLIRPLMDARGWSVAGVAGSLSGIHAEHLRAYRRFTRGFEAALVEARDAVSGWLLHAVRSVAADTVRFDVIAARMLEPAASERPEQFTALLQVFLRRGIDPRPHFALAPLYRQANLRASRRWSAAVLQPTSARHPRPCCDLRHVGWARGLMPHEHRTR